MKKVLTILLILNSNIILSQNSNELERLFESGNYSLYVSYFEEIYNKKSFDIIDHGDVSNYIVSLLNSNFNYKSSLPSRKLKPLKNKIENYILLNRKSTRSFLLKEYGKFQFNQGKFKLSIKFLELLDKKDSESNYLLGLSLFNDKNYSDAKKYLDLLNNEKYLNDKNYLLGVIAYLNNNFKESLEYFNVIEKEEIKRKFLQYQISIYFLNGQYNRATELLKSINDNVENADYCYYYIGKSYFELNDYKNTLEVFSKINKKLDRDDEIHFTKAYSYYMLKDYDIAKIQFKTLTEKRNNYSQVSSFYLGMIFLDQKEINIAKNYFYAAYRNDFNETYTKRSLLNYAKTIYELGDHDLSIAVLEKMKNLYPSFKSDEVESLLSENYFMTNNYSKIIQYLNTKKNISDDDKIKFQYVTYQKGINEFNRGNFKNSIGYFNLSQRYTLDKNIYLKSVKNKAEAYFIGNNFQLSIDEILKILDNLSSSNTVELNLLLGYSYFNINDYKNASFYLKKYIDAKSDNYSSEDIDPLLRLADSYYASKQFLKSIDTYNQLISLDESNKNYINYQIGLCYYGINNFTKSIEFMDKVIVNSEKSLDDDATFRKAQIYFENSEFDKSIENYTKVIEEYRFSSYVPYSYLNRATSYFNLRAYDQAEVDYLYILNNIKDSDLQSQSILGLQKTVSYTDNFSQLNELINTYKDNFPDNDNIKIIQFDNFRNLYFNQKYKELIEYANDINISDENIYNSYETNYFLAESYYKLNQLENAENTYNILIDSINSKYYSRSLNRLANINLKLKLYDKSLEFYKSLELNSKNNRERVDAYIGSLTNYYFLKKYDSVHYYSSLINNYDKISFNNRNKINLLNAKSFIDKGNFSNAIDMLLTTINLVKDESAVEANYLLAKIFYDQSLETQALETLYSLNENFSNYDYWVGRSYLLIAEIFISMGESFQAKATLESLLENTEINEIKNNAEELLNKIQYDE
tara:strand:+ start:3029 stop:5962 length:2934 start_codon:yes stop_codon:yes gene_type:complete